MPIFIYKREIPPTPTGCTTIFDYDFTSWQVTNNTLISDWWTSVGVNYWLQVASNNSWLQWVNAQTDTPAWIEFAYPDSLVGKRVTWDFEVYVADFDTWWWPKLSLFGSYVAWGWTSKYNNISNIRFAETCWEYNSWRPSYSNMSTWEVYIYWSWTYSWDQASPVYWWSLYWTPNLGLDWTLWIYRMEWYYDFDSWTYYNKWTNPNWATAEWTRTFDNTSDADKAIMEGILTSSTKWFAIEITRWYGSRTWQRIRKAKVDVCWVEEWNYYFSSSSFNEYQSLVDTVWSINFLDSWSRFRFNYWVYIWNRTALDFNWTTMRTINLDTLTVTSSKSSTINGRVRYFWDNRILTSSWIADFQWNIITSFSYSSVTPWDDWVVWANNWDDIYKWIVNWDNITFTKVWTWWTDQWRWWMSYWKLWAYLLHDSDNRNESSWYSSYINPTTWAITNFITPDWWDWESSHSHWSRSSRWVSWPDGKFYRYLTRRYWRWTMQKLWTDAEGKVWTYTDRTSWLLYWCRFGKLLWNIVSWWMNTNNWTWNGYCSNNYFVETDWTFTKVQDNAFAYDSEVFWCDWFIDEKWWLYPRTWGWWSWVILKPNVDLTFNRKNPYLWR